MNKGKILEYITNLENQNELLQDNIYKLQDRIVELEENNNRFYNENCKLREKHNINDILLLDENYNLQQRINKAEEYIKNGSLCDRSLMVKNDLLDILKGE